MLLFDKRQIGDRLLLHRKRIGMTQAEIAQAAGLSDRTYADIERGETNMRVGSLLQICKALHVTPDEILTDRDYDIATLQSELINNLEACTLKDRSTALELLKVYLQSLR